MNLELSDEIDITDLSTVESTSSYILKGRRSIRSKPFSWFRATIICSGLTIWGTFFAMLFNCRKEEKLCIKSDI